MPNDSQAETAEAATRASLFALYEAFWDEMQSFYVEPTFDHRGSYSGRKRDELNRIKEKYRPAIEHYRVALTLGINTDKSNAAEAGI